MACQWYDRAVDALLKPAPVTEMAGPKPHSDALVSMGVSYWAVGNKDRAFELTQAGVRLAEQGLSENLISESDVQVAQHNLDAMNRAMGNGTQFAEADGDSSEPHVSKAQAKSPVKRAGGRSSQVRTANRSANSDTRRR
jgi:hypothetical protein